jgi:hypothetical protein
MNAAPALRLVRATDALDVEAPPEVRESCAETAVRVRRALKERFPTVRFSVRSRAYSGGTSIDVAWTDGPTRALVDSVIGRYASACYDPMEDVHAFREPWLEENGRRIIFGAHYVDTHRSLSAGFRQRILDELARRYELPPLQARPNGEPAASTRADLDAWWRMFNVDAGTVVYRFAENRAFPDYVTFSDGGAQ